jgi:hypothetical protein
MLTGEWSLRVRLRSKLELKMAKLKTTQNEQSVEGFLNSVPDEKRRRDSFTVLEMMKKLTGEEPKM